MNFLTEVQKGLEGRNQGLNTGLPRFNKFINGIQKKTYYLIGSTTKTGKTALVDKMFVLGPYLNNPNAKINWIYFSFEIDRVEKMAKFCALFMDVKHGIYCDSNYILSRGENRLDPSHYELVKSIYDNELVDLFGTYDNIGNVVKKGRIDFFQDKINPEGIRKYLMKYAENNGEFVYGSYRDSDGVVHKKIIGYNEKDPDLYTIIMIDHVGLLRREQGNNVKDNIDKMSEHFVFFRNICNFSPVAVSQFNRDLGKTDRLKFSGEQLQPSLEDFKNSGNLAEDASLVIAPFNPTVYPHLERHLGYDLTSLGRSYRSVHILASRNTESNVNISFVIEGKTGNFKELPKVKDDDDLKKVYKYVKEKGLC